MQAPIECGDALLQLRGIRACLRQMTGKAGTAYLFNGRIYHCAVNNESNHRAPC